MIRNFQFLHIFICVAVCLGFGHFNQASAQDSTVAVLTRIEQVVRLSPTVRSAIGEESFPDYLAQKPELQNSIFQTIKTSLASKFPVKELVVKQPAGPWLDFRNIVAPVQIDRNRGEGSLYVAVQQVIQLTTTGADSLGMPVKNFLSTCTVQVQDKGGKTVFSNKLIQPFSTVSRSGQMYGLTEISADDWAKLLTTSIATALDNTTQRLPSQLIYRPPLKITEYGLTDASARFCILQETEKSSSYKGANRDKTVSFREAGRVLRLWSYNQGYSLNEGFIRGEYRTRILLADKALGTEYDITAASTLVRDSANIFSKTISPIQIRCTAQRLLVGDYTMTEKKFEGQVGYDIYSIRAVPPRNTFELRINDKVKTLIQKGSLRNQAGARRQESYLYISRDVDENGSDKILLTYLIYQIANEMGRDFLGY